MRVLIQSLSVEWMVAWGSSVYRILSPMTLWCPQSCWDGCGTLTSLLLLPWV